MLLAFRHPPLNPLIHKPRHPHTHSLSAKKKGLTSNEYLFLLVERGKTIFVEMQTLKPHPYKSRGGHDFIPSSHYGVLLETSIPTATYDWNPADRKLDANCHTPKLSGS